LITAAHERDLAVIPWTVNDPRQMRSLIDRGVDGITTDDPQRLRDVLGGLGRVLPSAALGQAAIAA
jgi:glycerophosphoryl diester phosphodiesterase